MSRKFGLSHIAVLPSIVFGFAKYLCCKKLQDTELALERRKVYLGFWLLRVHPMVMGCIAVRQSILDWWKR